jgi:hypothetical protein
MARGGHFIAGDTHFMTRAGHVLAASRRAGDKKAARENRWPRALGFTGRLRRRDGIPSWPGREERARDAECIINEKHARVTDKK